MYQIILVIHILLSLSIIGLVLIQRGKGAEMGAGFGGGASQTLFGSSGSGSFLTRSTAILATLFFISCIALSYVAVHMGQGPADYLPEIPAEIPVESSAISVPVIPSSTEIAPVTDLPAVPNLQQDVPASEPAIITPAPTTDSLGGNAQ